MMIYLFIGGQEGTDEAMVKCVDINLGNNLSFIEWWDRLNYLLEVLQQLQPTLFSGTSSMIVVWAWWNGLGK